MKLRKRNERLPTKVKLIEKLNNEDIFWVRFAAGEILKISTIFLFHQTETLRTIAFFDKKYLYDLSKQKYFCLCCLQKISRVFNNLFISN